MLPGSREVQASGPVKEDTVIGPKIAAVERRKVRVPVKRHAGAFAKVPSYDLRHFGAPLPHFLRESEMKAQPRASVRGRWRTPLWRRKISRGLFEQDFARAV